MIFNGLVWRYVPKNAEPLHVHYILHAEGRWNRAGEYGCLYTALTLEGLAAEYRKYRDTDEIDVPRDLFALDLSLAPVIDLSDPGALPWWTRWIPRPWNPWAFDPVILGDEDHHIEQCRRLSDRYRTQGAAGLLVPSATRKGETNLVAFIDGPPRNLSFGELLRAPLNYGPYALLDASGEVQPQAARYYMEKARLALAGVR